MKLSDTIRICCGTDKIERHAAEELKKYLSMITGGTYEIIQPASLGTSVENCILIGGCAPMTEEDRNALVLDGFLIRTLPHNVLMLCGNEPVSSLFAVYALLEDYCGCGFFEDGDQVPHGVLPDIGDIDRIDNPRYQYRVHIINGSIIYSGILWWDAEQLKNFFDSLVKKRINTLYIEIMLYLSSLIPDTLRRMGYDVSATEFQKQKTADLQEAYAYAQKLGIRFVLSFYDGFQTEIPVLRHDGVQIHQFVTQYLAAHPGENIAYTYYWCDIPHDYLNWEHPEVQRFYATMVTIYRELFGDEPYYGINLPSEGGFSEKYSLKETGEMLVKAFQCKIKVIKEANPDAVIFSSAPFPYCKTYQYQKKAVAGQDIIQLDYNDNQPCCLHTYQNENYFNGQKWVCGALSHCSYQTNPSADLPYAFEHFRDLASDLRCNACVGFVVGRESIHRNIMANDLYYRLSWNPLTVDYDEFMADYARRRYGTKELIPAVKAVCDTLCASWNFGMENCVTYRNFQGLYRAGLVADSVKISIGFLPKLHDALEQMLALAPSHEDNALLRFDMIDIGRTYLGFFFNLYFAGTRLGGHFADEAMIAGYKERALRTMDDIARLCGASPEFRLGRFYDWAARWPSYTGTEPGPEPMNQRSIYILFTNLLFGDNRELIDYMSEDYTELIMHYYKPRMDAYMTNLLDLVKRGEKLSEDLPIPNRCNDFAPPRGKIRWSAFGATAEPQLMKDDNRIRFGLIDGPSAIDDSLFYDGPIAPLFADIFAQYPITDEIEHLLSLDKLEGVMEEDDGIDMILTIPIGESVAGVSRGVVVEQYDIVKDVLGLFDLTVLGTEYNIVRGNINRTRIRATDFLSYTRIEDALPPDGIGIVKQFTFESFGKKYLMLIDEGAETRPASLYVNAAQ